MKNIFQIGGIVKGESFIGRKDLLQKFRKNLLCDGRSSSISIIGVTRSGKTSFVKKVFEELPQNFKALD